MEKDQKQNLPKHIQGRIELSGLFYPMDRNSSRRWGTTLKKGFDSWSKKLLDKAQEMDYSQAIIQPGTITWKDLKSGNIQCMFKYIKDPMVLSAIENIFKEIRSMDPFFTYVFLNQVKDGEHCWDIFRLSKFSYLEHCNRIYSTK